MNPSVWKHVTVLFCNKVAVTESMITPLVSSPIHSWGHWDAEIEITTIFAYFIVDNSKKTRDRTATIGQVLISNCYENKFLLWQFCFREPLREWQAFQVKEVLQELEDSVNDQISRIIFGHSPHLSCMQLFSRDPQLFSCREPSKAASIYSFSVKVRKSPCFGVFWWEKWAIWWWSA